MEKTLKGLRIETPAIWYIEGQYDYPAVLRSLHILFPSDATLYFEGSFIEDKVLALFQQYPATNIVEVYPGTIAPKPKCFHVQMNSDLIKSLSTLAENLAETEVADHFHVYRNNTMLMTGYDFGSLSLVIADLFPSERVSEFAHSLKCKFKRIERPL